MNALSPRMFALACALLFALAGCTNDFDKFEPQAGTNTDGGPHADSGARDSDSFDGYVNEAGEASCTPSASCLSTAISCAQGCDQAELSCVGGCGSSTPCQNKCKGTQRNCRTQCEATCETCTQNAGCLSASACMNAVP